MRRELFFFATFRSAPKFFVYKIVLISNFCLFIPIQLGLALKIYFPFHLKDDFVSDLDAG